MQWEVSIKHISTIHFGRCFAFFPPFRGDFDVGKEGITMPNWPCFNRLMVKHKAQKEALFAQFAYCTASLCATPL